METLKIALLQIAPCGTLGGESRKRDRVLSEG